MSVALIVILVLLVRRVRGLAPADVDDRTRLAARITFGLTMVSVVLGTLVTGSAPHGGDADAIRTGFVLEVVAKLHAWSGWAVLIAGIVTLALSRHRTAWWLVITVLGQAGIGYAQYFAGLPIWIIALHIIGVAVVTAVSANLVFALGADPEVSGS